MLSLVMLLIIFPLIGSDFKALNELNFDKVPERQQRSCDWRDPKNLWQELYNRPHFIAAASGNLKRLQEIVGAQKIQISDEHFSDGSNLLHFAASSSTPELLEYLISNRVQIDKENARGHSPLFLSFVHRKLANITVLLNHGADPLVVQSIYVVKNNKRVRDNEENFVKDYLAPIQSADAVEWASYLDFNDGLKLLYEKGTKFQKANPRACEYPISKNDSKTFYQLLSYGMKAPFTCSTCRTYPTGETNNFGCEATFVLPLVLYGSVKQCEKAPLAFACPRVFCARESLLEVELDASAPLHQVDFLGALPLHYAIGQGNIEMVKQLLEKGSNVYQRTIYGQRTLDIVRTILKRDTYQDNTKKEDYTALTEILTEAELVKEAALLRSNKKYLLPTDMAKHIRMYVEGYPHA